MERRREGSLQKETSQHSTASIEERRSRLIRTSMTTLPLPANGFRAERGNQLVSSQSARNTRDKVEWREKRGTVMLFQTLSKGGQSHTLSLLQAAGSNTTSPPPSTTPQSLGTKAEKSPRGSTIKRVFKRTLGDRGRPEATYSPDKTKANPNIKWRHSVAFFSQMGTGFEKMLHEEQQGGNKRWVNMLGNGYQSPADLERRYRGLAACDLEELHQAQMRVTEKLRARLVEQIMKPETRRRRLVEEVTEKAEVAEAADFDSSEYKLFSTLKRGMEQQLQGEKKAEVEGKVEEVAPAVDSAEVKEPETATKASPWGRERSATIALFRMMNQGAMAALAGVVEDSDDVPGQISDEEDETQWDQQSIKDSEVELQLVRDVNRLRGTWGDDEGLSLLLFSSPSAPSKKALPLDALGLILGLSCESPKEVGYFHLVNPSWARFLAQDESEAVWALWYKRHFGGGPLLTSNQREFPLSWREAYQAEWISLKSRQRAEIKAEDPAFNMLLHFIRRGHVVLVRELLSTHPNPEELVSRASASTTPLNCACMVGSLPIVELLVAYGAEVFLLCFFTPHIWSFLHPFIHLTDQCPSWTKRLDTLLPSLHARLLPYCQLLSHWWI